jgi:hypothetical protein
MGKWICRHEANIKMVLKKECGMILWTEVIRVRIGTDRGIL